MKTKLRKSDPKDGAKASRMKLSEIMTRSVEVVSPDETLQNAARKMRLRDVGFLPVCDGQRLVGTLSDRDITVRAVAEGLDPRSTAVRDLATQNLVWCFDDEDVVNAARKMRSKQIRRLMVINRQNKQLVGVVSLGDLAANGTRELSGEVLQSVSPVSV